MAATLSELVAQAPKETVELIRAVLEQESADELWARQLGPSLSQRSVARLLGKSEQAVSKDRRLLRLRTRSGRPVYPVFQFDGRRPKDGVAEVVAALGPAVTELTIASWLTAPNRLLDERRPIDALDAGEVESVVTLARRFARSAG